MRESGHYVFLFGACLLYTSLMRQYTPMYKSADYPEIDRTLTSFEYESVLHMAAQAGMSGYRQGRSSATSEQTPAFDGTGVLHAD